MSDDHLSNEVSISAELTERGVKAGAKSRTLAAVDRLLGGVVDLANVPIERIAQKGRAKTDTQVAAIKTLGEKQLEAIHSDPDFAARAMQQHLKVIGVRHENKTEAVRAALEDLRETPPTEEQNNSGGEQLDDAFLNRWERYAEDATSDQLREKWGRVLASEIRVPGTFSGKVLRIVDELDAEAAIVFEDFCRHRIGSVIPTCLTGELAFEKQKTLVEAGLIIDPGGVFHRRQFAPNPLGDGTVLWLSTFNNRYIGARLKSETSSPSSPKHAVYFAGSALAVQVYILTETGVAISSILPDNSESAVDSYLNKIVLVAGVLDAREYERQPNGEMSLVRTILKQASSA